MKTHKQKKSGFTLVELMVVAIIVAILAAVAIPLMSGNRDRAIATEAQGGCSTVATALKLYYAEHGDVGTFTSVTNLPGINSGDLNGTYFLEGGYDVTSWTANDAYTIEVDGATGTDAEGDTVTMTVTGGAAVWGGLGQ